MTPSGIDLAIFWFAPQCFNQLRHRVPLNLSDKTSKYPEHPNTKKV
jgi:hypothetical protein